MFSFIKKLQYLIEKIKKNRGLFFTTLTVVSVSAIAIFMYIILSMTGVIKEDVYKSIASNLKQEKDYLLDFRKSKYIDIAEAIISNKELIDAIKKNDKKIISNYLAEYNKKYKRLNFQSLIVNIYPITDTKTVVRNTISSVLRSKAQIFGVEVQRDGVFITLIKPIKVNGVFIGLVEIKESIHSLKNDFAQKDFKYVFLLNKKMLAKLSLRAKSGRYKDVIGDYVVYQSAYSSRFYSKITDKGESAFAKGLKKGFDSDDAYYRSFHKVADINSADIGLFVIGESIEKNKGFVNIADRLVKSVTYVSLGLVVSILLFMF